MLYFASPVCENTLVPASVRPAADVESAMSNKRPVSQSFEDLSFTVQIRPLGDADVAFLQVAMAEIAPDWSVELQGICADEATLVLLPEDGDDETGPSFMITRETYGFR